MVFPDPESRSAKLFERARRVLLDGTSRSTVSLPPYPLYVRAGAGARVIDVDGNELIDFNNNYTSLIHGHANPVVADAVRDQIARGTAFSFGTEQEIELAELLCGRVPSFERIRFTNSGTEAVMNAIKAARAQTGRPKIAKCEGAYHGSYDFAEVSLSAAPDEWGEHEPVSVPYAAGTPAGVLDDVVVIPFNDAAAAESILERHAADLAGVLIDPVSSRVGMIPLDAEFLDMLRRFTARHGQLLIFDEVIAFRRDYLGHQGVLDVEPDLTALGKIIGGGFPIGAVAGKAEIMSVFEERGGKAALPHGGTFNANPVSMSAGRACMDLMTPEAFARLNALGDLARQYLRDAVAAAGCAAQVTGEGSLFRLHLTDRELTGYRAAFPTADETARMAALHRHLINEGIFVASYGMGCLSTAMVEADLERLAETVESGLRALS